jgi:putative pyruvate formate lyase activating enzyme
VARLYRHRVEYGEELELVPSQLLYLSGCDLRCAFCIGEQNAFDPRRGRPLTAALLDEAVQWGQCQGARNIQWAGGEPTIHLPAILAAMDECPELPPLVWKSNFHGTPESFQLLQGLVDVYVADFKFGNDACAKRIARVDGYWGTVTRNLAIAATQGDLIVRHLLLPGHFECCYRPIVAWLGRNMRVVKFSVREGYLPRWRARRYAELGEPLKRGVGRAARELAAEQGLNTIS